MACPLCTSITFSESTTHGTCDIGPWVTEGSCCYNNPDPAISPAVTHGNWNPVTGTCTDSIGIFTPVANTDCITNYSVILDCPVDAVTQTGHDRFFGYLQYSVDGSPNSYVDTNVTYNPQTRQFNESSYPMYKWYKYADVEPNDGFMSTNPERDWNLTHRCDPTRYEFQIGDLTTEGIQGFSPNSGSPFQKNGTGYYRIRAEIWDIYSSDICEQFSNALLITIGTSAGEKVDLEAAGACGCQSSDPVHGASAELALNWVDSAPRCSAKCFFETQPVLAITNAGDVIYTLPKMFDRSVKLYNIGTAGVKNPSKSFVATRERMYFDGDAGKIAEVSYTWPGRILDWDTGAGLFYYNSPYSETFKVGVKEYDWANQWATYRQFITGKFYEHPGNNDLSPTYRQRHINLNPSGVSSANWTLGSSATNSSSIHRLNPGELSRFTDIAAANQVISGIATPESPMYYGLFDIEDKYAAHDIANDFWVNRGEQLDFGFIIASDYDAGDSAGDLNGTVLVNLEPYNMSQWDGTIGSGSWPVLQGDVDITLPDFKPMFLYPEWLTYNQSNFSNPGLLSQINTTVGIASTGFTYRLEAAQGLDSLRISDHLNIYTFNKASTAFVTGTSNHPCSGEGADCPPFYHSTDDYAPHATEGRLQLLNRIEYVSNFDPTILDTGAVPSYNIGTYDQFPSSSVHQKLRNADGTCVDNDCVSGEGWYHIAVRDWNTEIYNGWNSSNAFTPALDSSSKQHWASDDGGGLTITRRLYWGNSSIITFRNIPSSLFMAQSHNIYFANDVNHGGVDGQTWMYEYSPFSCGLQLGGVPHEVDEAGLSKFQISDVHNEDKSGLSTCTMPLALNYIPTALPITPSTYLVRKAEDSTCLFCDKMTGNIESYLEDATLQGDAGQAFEYVSSSVTPATYANWGDGVITMTVVKSLLFELAFDFSSVTYKYKAVLYRVPIYGGVTYDPLKATPDNTMGAVNGWQDPDSYIVAGGIQDELETPTVTFSSTTYPVPLLVPKGDYSIKWSINVIAPGGTHEVEQCWFEYPISVSATNPIPARPIAMVMNMQSIMGRFQVQVVDTRRAAVPHRGFGATGGVGGHNPNNTTPPFVPHTYTFDNCNHGRCLDNGQVTNVAGTDITTVDAPAYSTEDGCINTYGANSTGIHTWEGFDPIATIEDVTAIPYGNNVANTTFARQAPVLPNTPVPQNDPIGRPDWNIWRSTFISPNITDPNGDGWNYYNSNPDSPNYLWPSEVMNIKVTWESGFTKTFDINTPIVSGYPFMNGSAWGWWGLAMNTPCMKEMWPPTNSLYHAGGHHQTPFNPIAITLDADNQYYGGANPYSERNLHLVTWCNPSNVNCPPKPSHSVLDNFHQSQHYWKVEAMPTQSPTYPYPVYEGVTAPFPIAINLYEGTRHDHSTTSMVNFSRALSIIEYAPDGILTCGMVLGGFTGELIYRSAITNITETWANANSSKVINVITGTRSTLGTSNHYDDLITSIRKTTGAPGTNIHTTPALPVGIGEAGELTEAAESGLVFEDAIYYHKDCPVCLPPEVPKACRWKTTIPLYGPDRWQMHAINRQEVPIPGALTYNHLGEWMNLGAYWQLAGVTPHRMFDDGSCVVCNRSTGKLEIDMWDKGDEDPEHFGVSAADSGNYTTNPYKIAYKFYKTNPRPVSSAGPIDPDVDHSEIVEGTGDILEANGARTIGNYTHAPNVLDPSTLGGLTWYKMEALMINHPSKLSPDHFQGYAISSLWPGVINIRFQWYEEVLSAFLAGDTSSISSSRIDDLQIHLQLYKYNGNGNWACDPTTTNGYPHWQAPCGYWGTNGWTYAGGWDEVQLPGSTGLEKGVIIMGGFEGGEWKTQTNSFQSGVQPGINLFNSYMSIYTDANGNDLTYGHYKLRVRAVDLAVNKLGLDTSQIMGRSASNAGNETIKNNISICFQDLHFNYRVQTCDTHQTRDSVVVSDANNRFVNPAIKCDCCAPVIPILTVTGSGCSVTHTISASYDCAATDEVTDIECELYFTPADGPGQGIQVLVGQFPLITGAYVTTGSVAFGSTISGNAALYGGTYAIKSTYTNDQTASGSGLDPCPDLTGVGLVVPPVPTCDCQNVYASNYLQVYPNGNADCVGVIGGVDYTCCSLPTSCSAPTAVLTSTTCNVRLTVAASCTLTTPPDHPTTAIALYIYDLSTSSGAYNASTSTLAYTHLIPGASVVGSQGFELEESCTLSELTALGGTSSYIIRQVQNWATGYSIETFSTIFTIGTGTNPSGTTHYPVICGCTVAVSGGITATNYNGSATCNDGSCIYPGCTDSTATNYNSAATLDDGSCLFVPVCSPVNSGQVVLGLTPYWLKAGCGTIVSGQAASCLMQLNIPWADCNLDKNGNIIEDATSILIFVSFSTDNGTTWIEDTVGFPFSPYGSAAATPTTPANMASLIYDTGDINNNIASEEVLDLFIKMHADGVTSSDEVFDCLMRYRIKSQYTSSPTAFSDYSETWIIAHPRTAAASVTTHGWLMNSLDVPNTSPGMDTNCHFPQPHSLLPSIASPHTYPGTITPTIILASQCGCTDNGFQTAATMYTTVGVAPYTSPIPGVAADNYGNNIYGSLDPLNARDDGSCEYWGCTDANASNYDAAFTNDCSGNVIPSDYSCCLFEGCTDPCATNYDSNANVDDGSCILPNPTMVATTSLTGCNQTFSFVIEDVGNTGQSWGFTAITYEVTFWNTVTSAWDSVVGSTTISAATSNIKTLDFIDACATSFFTTKGIGTYRLEVWVPYPNGLSACIINLPTINFSISSLVSCDCLNCTSCSNYNASATCDDGSCTGCTDATAGNYDAGSVIDDGSCLYYGCTDATAANFDFLADATHIDDGSCLWWHVWEECTSGDRTSFGGGSFVGPVSLAANQLGLTYINPTETIGQAFLWSWYDGTAWNNNTACWKYIGPQATAEYYTHPLNTTGQPSQWVFTNIPVSYSTCTLCIPIPGCTDDLALNFNSAATLDDGSCTYPCCSTPTLLQASGHVDSCDVEYRMFIDCNAIATDHCNKIVTELQYWDGSVWQVAHTSTYQPNPSANSIDSHSYNYHYNCSTDNFGGYGTGLYRTYSRITYLSGYVCHQYSASTNIIIDSGGCTDPTANNYDASALCQCVACTYTYCCDTPVITLDLSNGICNQSLVAAISCTPAADDGYTALWQSFATGSWVTLDTQTSAGPTSATTLTLANSFLHTTSGTSENYRLVLTSDYTAPTADCTVYSNILTVVAPVLGCMDGGVTEYTVGPGGTGFGTAGDGITASNYDLTAQCDNGTCCIDGCSDALANNYLASTTCNTVTCTYDCCDIGTLALDYTLSCYPTLTYTSDISVCPTPPTQLSITWYYTDGTTATGVSTVIDNSPVDGTVYTIPNAVLIGQGDGHWYVTILHEFGGTTVPSCSVTSPQLSVILPVFGCTNSLSSNFDPLATCDDGGCIPPISACTDPLAVNYNSVATIDDGSCIYCNVGCTDAVGGPYSNYPETPPATCDCDGKWLEKGTCSAINWFDEVSCTAHGTCSIGLWYTESDCCINNGGTWNGSSCSGGSATFTAGVWTGNYTNNLTSGTWNTCCLDCVYGCMDTSVFWNNYNSNATCPCTDLVGTEPCNSSTLALTGTDCCCTNCINGCTDGGNKTQAWWIGGNLVNYDYATVTGLSLYGVGINSGGANNYDSTATCEDGSCTYNGCMDDGSLSTATYPTLQLSASNFGDAFTGDCAGVVGGTDHSCCIYPVIGCTDPLSLNPTALATIDDASCMYCDVATGNYENSAGVDQAPWATGGSNQIAASSVTATDGQVSVSFALSATGLLMQQTSEFQNGNNDFVITLYSVSTACAASSTGTLVSTGISFPAATSTTIVHNFTGLSYGYYTARLTIDNNTSFIESTQCWVDTCATIKAKVCADSTAANYTTIHPSLQQPDSSLCVYPGYCACTETVTVTTGAACSNSATLYGTVECNTDTDITWSWLDSTGSVIISGTSLGVNTAQIVSTLPITANETYSFEYTETSTPYLTCPTTTTSLAVSTIIDCACTDDSAVNYNANALYNCLGNPVPDQSPGWNSSPCCLPCIYGCTDPAANNYNKLATCDDSTCILPGEGCKDPNATNYNSAATLKCRSCCEYCNESLLDG